MQKTSFLYLLLLLGVSLLAAHGAFSDASAQVSAIRFLALSALFLLCVSLMIGPLAVLQPQTFAPLIEPRRAVGLAAFFFAALHTVLVMALYFGWDFSIALSFQSNLLAAMAFVLLAALALTSCDFAVQKLGMAKWKTLQYFAYPAFALILAHFVLNANGLVPKSGAATGLNIAEASLVFLSALAIALQVSGFCMRCRRKKEASRPSQ